MSLVKLDIFAVRNILKASLSPSLSLNFIYGQNASGKSSLIEAIFILGRAKSFRTATIKSVIHFDHAHLIVAAQNLLDNGNTVHLGVQLDSKTCCCRINQQTTLKRSDLAYSFPLQLIYPKSYELLDSGSQIRREFLDWGVFNQNNEFLPVWRNFKRALSQRNSLLKTRKLDSIHIWNKELVYYGIQVNEQRELYLQRLKPFFNEILGNFLAVDQIDLQLYSGWDLSKDLNQILIDELERDTRLGFTQSGPHRADFKLLINKRLAKDIISRGQLKLFVISLKLAQVKLLMQTSGNKCCILVDDFAAELDEINRAKLIKLLASLQCQVFMTATEISDFGDLTGLDSYKMFHVEHGEVNAVGD